MKVLASPLLYEWGAVMKTAVVFESTVCNFKLRIQAAGIWSNEMIEDGSQCDDAPQKNIATNTQVAQMEDVWPAGDRPVQTKDSCDL